ncbi:unnamed protein product [Bursaphelenchus okinawaensis]|uniref:[histone H3]-trimethyl-L-lysine(4) demethylase n=1 Tax=Bursaphelenchus okinawaensis TaxID=465554 RepID=A0A811KP13_9BILA|nr:unnamed protein product [Bursaphelenchus okinawaensis]CAG9109530.1 unnamed protein product [Bursaphelenchus okinawaensis]
MLKLYTEFRPPPEARTYRPTPVEFKDPIRYINSIREEAEKEGIIKIIPPKNAFNHRCVINPDTYTIDTRFQKLCGIDMLCRDRMYFIKQLEVFWFNYDITFTWPYINDCYIDMKRLYELVTQQGGPNEVTKAQHWPEIAKTLGFQANNGQNMREIYTKWLQPFKENFLDHEKVTEDVILLDPNEDVKAENSGKEAEVKEEQKEEEDDDAPPSKRLRKGRMMAGVRCKNVFKSEATSKITGKCGLCMKTTEDGDADFINCTNCNQEFHSECVLMKQCKTVPMKWKCRVCLKKELKEYEFYFIDNDTTKTLTQFRTKANQFKRNYFKIPNSNPSVSMVNVDEIEKEYWKNVADFESKLEVEYGADLESKKLGSGFPRITDIHRGADMDRKAYFARHPWNLNNLPVLNDSALSHVGTDISGMVVPWVYVGMCFSTFCWHVEDHWTYSMNYMHLGETKVWYGFGREYADKFEEVMKRISPDLFQQNPTMLNTMHNMLNPAILMENGIPVKTIRQNAGEFVVTFPRAYHAGFNSGLNVAEAVNFAPCDWLAVGRQCVENYMRTSRCCVFAHDELIFNLANSKKTLSLGMLAAVFDELEEIYRREVAFRKQLGEANCKNSEFCEFGNLPDDDRSCAICGTTLYVTGLEYRGEKQSYFGCSRHFRTLIKKFGRENMIVRYSLTLQQMSMMKQSIVQKVHAGNEWRKQVKIAMTTRIPYREANSMLAIFQKQQLPSCEEKEQLQNAMNIHNEYFMTANRILAAKIKLRDETRIQRADDRVSPHSLMEMIKHMKRLVVHDQSTIDRLEARYRDYLKWTWRYNQISTKEKDLSQLEFIQAMEKIQQEAEALNMKLDEIDEVKYIIKVANWKLRVDTLIHMSKQSEDLDTDHDFSCRATMTELDELRFYGRSHQTNKRVQNATALVVELDRMRALAVRKLDELESYFSPTTSYNLEESRGFEDVMQFAEGLRVIHWFTSDELEDFRTEFKNLEDLHEEILAFSENDVYKLSGVYQLMRKITKNPLLINPVELDLLEEKRDAILAFIEQTYTLMLKERTYHSVVQCLLPRRDLISMAEEATEKLYKQHRDGYSDEWPELKNINTIHHLRSLFPVYDADETIRLLSKAREKNLHMPASKSCIDSPTCSKKLTEEDKADTIQCFVCLQSQHVSCALWSYALDNYPEGLYLCHRCCRSERPLIEDVRKMVANAPQLALEVELVRLATQDVQKQWNSARESQAQGSITPLHYALTLELYDSKIFNALYERFGPKFDEEQKQKWRRIRENNREMPLTTNGTRDTIPTFAKKRKYRCMRIRTLATLPFRRKASLVEKCASETCLQFRADSYRELQCILCEKWYHLACTDVPFEDAKMITSFHCNKCSTNSQPKNLHAAMPRLEPQNELIILE